MAQARGNAPTAVIGPGEAAQCHRTDEFCFVAPTVFDGATNDRRIAREEIVGPVLSVLSFDAHRLARQLRVGSVSVNTVDMVSVATPFGGFKQSGNGRDLSLHALDKFTALKTTWISL